MTETLIRSGVRDSWLLVISVLWLAVLFAAFVCVPSTGITFPKV
jgi:hypothetical protein